MKKILNLLFLLLAFGQLYGQYPIGGSKLRLGFQTTGDGLIYRSDVIPSIQNLNLNNSYLWLYKPTHRLYSFDSLGNNWKPLTYASGVANFLPRFVDENTLDSTSIEIVSGQNYKFNFTGGANFDEIYLGGIRLSNSAGNLPNIGNLLQNGITGAGIPGQLAYYTDYQQIYSSPDLTFLESKLGIRTETPDSTLTVIGSGRFTTNLLIENDAYTINLGSRDISGTYDTRIYISDTQDEVYDRDYMLYSASPRRSYHAGVLGIGVQPDLATGLRIVTDSLPIPIPSPPPGGGYAGTVIGLNVSNNTTSFGTNIGGRFSAYGSDKNRAIEISSFTDPNGYAIYSSTTAMTYLNGNVGIKTAVPDSTLTLVGSANISSNVKIGGDVTLKRLNVNTYDTEILSVNNYAPASTIGKNIWIGNGGQSSTGTAAQGTYNTSVGFENLFNNTTGYQNTSIGVNALNSNTSGSSNHAFGVGSLFANTTGYNNIGIGLQSLVGNISGYENIGIGTNAGSLLNNASDNTTGNKSIFIGDDTRASGNGQTNQIVIGSGGRGNGSNTTTIGNTSTTATILPAGKLGIGTTTPDSVLTITGGIRTTTSINTGSDATINGVRFGRGSGGVNTNFTAGRDALFSNTSGGLNTAVGTFSLLTNTIGNFNTGVGYNSLFSNLSGNSNTALGNNALYTNSMGNNNTGLGNGALFLLGSASDNTAIGFNALYSLTTGGSNVALGYESGRYITAGTANQISTNSLYLGYDTRASANGNSNEIVIGYQGRGNGSNTTTIGNTSTTATILPAGKLGIGTTTPDSVLTITGGIRTTTSINTGSDATINGVRVGRGTSNNVNSVAVGSEALISATSAGNSNTAVGYRALKSNTTGFYNTAIGLEALTTNTTVANLTAVGFQALRANTTGYYNTAVGSESLKATTIGHNNTAIGIATLRDNTTGIGNTAMGSLALLLPTGANYNVAIGTEALENDSTGSSNVAVGSFALTSNKTGNENTGVGHASLLLNTTGLNNSALGTNSARGNTTGGSNTAIGSYSLYTNSTGSNNVAVGSAALFASTASNNTAVGVSSLTANTTGGANTALGYQAMLLNTTAGANTGLGAYALLSNTTGTANTSVGHAALYSNTTSGNNTALGFYAMYATTGGNNTAIGSESLRFNTTGTGNTAVGQEALYANLTGGSNVAVGNGALRNNTNNENTAVGLAALNQNTSGYSNTAVGYVALYTNSSGINTGIGAYSLYSNSTGSINTAVGYGSLHANTTGQYNTAVGHDAGRYTNAGGNNNTTSYSIYIGPDTRSSASGNSNEIVIGSSARGQGSNSIMLGNSSVTNLACYDTSISSPSDERDKKEVEALEIGLDFLKKIEPVVFTWNMRDGGKKDIKDIGFIAQQVYPIQALESQGENLDVVNYNPIEDRYYMQSANLIPVLVKAIQEQQSQIEDLKKQIQEIKSQINK